MISFHRGVLGPTDQLGLLGVDDVLGTLRGYRIFSTARTAGGRLLDQAAHLQRLRDAAGMVGMGVGEGIAMIESAIPSLLQANGCDARDVVMQLFLSGGGYQKGEWQRRMMRGRRYW